MNSHVASLKPNIGHMAPVSQTLTKHKVLALLDWIVPLVAPLGDFSLVIWFCAESNWNCYSFSIPTTVTENFCYPIRGAMRNASRAFLRPFLSSDTTNDLDRFQPCVTQVDDSSRTGHFIQQKSPAHRPNPSSRTSGPDISFLASCVSHLESWRSPTKRTQLRNVRIFVYSVEAGQRV